MRNILKTAIALSVVVASSAFAAGSANIGYVTDYYYRGGNLGDAGAYAGLDYEADSGFYVGVWGIDDGTGGNDGLEIDYYLGYGFTAGGVDLGIGYTAYTYTYTDDEETEINLSAGYGPVSFEHSIGDDTNAGSADSEYTYTALSVDLEGIGITFGTFGEDADGDVFEVSYGFSAGGLDYGFTLGDSDAGDDPYMFLDISKGFDL